MEITVNGKAVVLRDRMPAAEFHHLRKEMIRQATAGEEVPWDERAKLLKEFVVSWEFDGDPKEVESWGQLDLFSEFIPLERAIGESIAERITNAKN